MKTESPLPIQNVGQRSWENCTLVCMDYPKDQIQTLQPLQTVVAIPTTPPNETVELAVDFEAPRFPCSAISYWKMQDPHGNVLFQRKTPLYCLVQVLDILH